MSIAPLLQADPVIQIHVATASLALVLGPFALYLRKRGRLHKTLGYVWVLAMGITAMSSFGIHSFAVIGPFSPIHLLAVFALWSIYEAMRHVFAGRIHLHQIVMRNLYWRGVIIAGLFNFLPGRLINRMVFEDARALGYVVIALGIGALVATALRQRRAPVLPEGQAAT